MGVSVSRRYCAFGLGTLRRTQLDAELVADLSEQILCIIFRNNIRHEALAIASRFKMFLDMQPGGAYFSSMWNPGGASLTAKDVTPVASRKDAVVISRLISRSSQPCNSLLLRLRECRQFHVLLRKIFLAGIFLVIQGALASKQEALTENQGALARWRR